MNQKEMKVVMKKIDPVLEGIKKVIPDNWTPQQVSAVFNLYMSLYE